MPLTRSEQMARIRGRDTRPERLLLDRLAAQGEICEQHVRMTGGRPDFLIPDRRVAVFVDGCFWHGCPEHYVRPRSRTDYWSERLSSNVERDRRQTAALEAAGWRVVRLWEHEVFEDIDVAVANVLDQAGPAAGPAWRLLAVEVVDSATDLERQHLVDLRGTMPASTRERQRTTKKWKVRAEVAGRAAVTETDVSSATVTVTPR